MELSQARTRNVLYYCLNISNLEISWVKKLITANGLSSSQPVLTATGVESPTKSRRVEFRVRTKIEDVMDRLLKKMEK